MIHFLYKTHVATWASLMLNVQFNFYDLINATCLKGNSAFYALTYIGSQYSSPLTLTQLYKPAIRSLVFY